MDSYLIIYTLSGCGQLIHNGLSPHEYLINYRINRSKILLRETEDTVGNISEAVGFGDVNNYIRYFKKLSGITPGIYRKLY